MIWLAEMVVSKKSISTDLGIRDAQELANIGVSIIQHADEGTRLRLHGQIGPVGERPRELPGKIGIIRRIDLGRRNGSAPKKGANIPR